MKTKLFITFFVLSCMFVGCKEPINTPAGGSSGYEAIQGKVVNEEGIALEGIRMAAYLDEQLTNPYIIAKTKSTFFKNEKYIFSSLFCVRNKIKLCG